MDPDFGIRASLNLASRERSKCRLKTEADSEIPALGLDSARMNIDCNVNPARVANAALRVARTYSQHRRERKKAQPYRSGSTIKRKKTRIDIATQYEKSNEDEDGHSRSRDPRAHFNKASHDDHDDDDDADA